MNDYFLWCEVLNDMQQRKDMIQIRAKQIEQLVDADMPLRRAVEQCNVNWWDFKSALERIYRLNGAFQKERIGRMFEGADVLDEYN